MKVNRNCIESHAREQTKVVGAICRIWKHLRRSQRDVAFPGNEKASRKPKKKKEEDENENESCPKIIKGLKKKAARKCFCSHTSWASDLSLKSILTLLALVLLAVLSIFYSLVDANNRQLNFVTSRTILTNEFQDFSSM